MEYSRVRLSKHVGTAVLMFAFCLTASGQELRGTVTNGTTGKPAAGDNVVLIRLEKGMDEEARTRTDGRGEFSLRAADLKTPHLISVSHQNVNYLEPVKPGSNSISITVYNAAAKVSEIGLLDQSQVYEAAGTTLRVIELLRFHNTSNPPVTQPAFELTLPEGAKVESGQAIPPSGMPIPSAPVPQTNNRYSVPYPLRPGVTQYELVYFLRYQGSYKASPKIEMPAEKFFVITPKSMQFASRSTTFHSDQWSIEPNLAVDAHAVDHPTPGTEYAFEVSGIGQLPRDSTQQASGAQEGNSRRGEDSGPGGGMGVPNERPNPLSDGQWKLLAILTLFMATGAAIVFATSHGQDTRIPATPQGHSTPILDALKEEMFQLEAERIQGKINGHDYDAAKAALVKTLQRAMRRKQ